MVNVLCVCGARSKSLAKGNPCAKCGITAEAWAAARRRVCEVCGKEFQATRGNSRVCGDPACAQNALRKRQQKAASKARAQARENAAYRAAYAEVYGTAVAEASGAPLGPDEPPKPRHVCAGYPGHKCNVHTADRRCPKCRAMWRAIHGVTGGHDLTATARCAIDDCAWL